MSRFTPIDLSSYPIAEIVEALAFESYLARDRADFAARWEARRAINPALPAIETLLIESDPASIVMEVGAYRETLVRGRVNDALKSLTLAAARGRALDHIAMTYFRGLARRVIAAADPAAGVAATSEDDETFRQRIALAPESWSTAGPEGAYLFHALSASGDVLDVAVYSEDEGVCLAPRVRVVVLSRLGDGTASEGLRASVRVALDRREIRPIGDHVIVESAVPLTFNVEVVLTIRNGASAALLEEKARERILAYCSGRMRWIGAGLQGPVWLVGRRMRKATIAAAAQGADDNIVEVEVISPATDVNAPHAGYTEEALADVGAVDFEPLAAPVTAHLFAAPRVGTVTVTSQPAMGTWS